MVVLGIDPGLATVGIGLIATSPKLHVLDYCTIETSKVLSTPERLQEIASDLKKIIRKHSPDLAVIEKLYFETNRKTAMQVSEARGVILLTVQQAGITILEPTPMELKCAVTGDGGADKLQMKAMLERTLGMDLTGVRDDAVDALGLALYGITAKSLTGVQMW